jgi:transglutaminase-like putative cysteine protease
MKKYRVVHKTQYEYALPVTMCHNEAHLSPRSYPGQQCLRHQLRIDPLPDVSQQRRDYFGNHATYFALQEPHTRLEVTATSEVELADPPVLRLDEGPAWDEFRDSIQKDSTPEHNEAREFVLNSPLVAAGPELSAFARPSFPEGRPLLEAVHELMVRIHSDFSYDPTFTTVATPLEEVLEHRRGVCQDFAHLAIGCIRSMGLPARYVSGYLESLPPPGQPRLVGADASHAWAAVLTPSGAWIDLDPTNCKMPCDAHVTLAWGRDYGDVTPLKGVILGGGRHTLAVSVDVEPLTV